MYKGTESRKQAESEENLSNSGVGGVGRGGGDMKLAVWEGPDVISILSA